MKEIHKPRMSASMAMVTDANGNPSTSTNITTTELSMLNNIRTNVQVQIDSKLNTLVGEVKYFAGKSVPSGYLLCNGSAVSRTTYDDLFAAIGTTWGEGDGSTTFNLPNLIDRVAWGGNTSGAYKEAGLPNITATIYTSVSADGAANVSGAVKVGSGTTADGTGGGYAVTGREATIDASIASSIYGKSSTVQPPAALLIPIIKY